MVTIRPYGERALLAEVDTLDDALALHASLAATCPPGVVELVPAARTVLVHVDPAVLSVPAARAWIAAEAVAPASVGATQQRTVTVDVRYDGADLADVAASLGMSAQALAARHAAARWTVAFTGFAPGFGYLVSPQWPFDVPRLPVPRTRVPAGAVGLAARFCGAYPRPTPGGWRLIGSTDAVLFDPGADDPVLLTPGTAVRFRPVAGDGGRLPAAGVPAGPDAAGTAAEGATDEDLRQHANVAATSASVGPTSFRAAAASAALQVVSPGLHTTVQDLGRAGRAHEGIARSGALDRDTLRLANRLVGNREDAAGLEIPFGGLHVRALRDVWVAVTGTWAPVCVDGRNAPAFAAVRCPAGSELRIGMPPSGVRVYVAVRGGIAAAAVAGSRAADTLAGIGPAPLAAGDLLQTADAVSRPVPPAPDVVRWPSVGDLAVDMRDGPRADWFTPAARAALFVEPWTVTDRADRVGMRLDGPVLERLATRELPSEGTVPGAVQVPPDGRPVILLADGPVTGGYPVIAVVADSSLDTLAQARPGTRLRFRHAP